MSRDISSWADAEYEMVDKGLMQTDRRMTKDILEEFEKLGMSASFHYADDTGSEWGLATRDQDKAIELFFKYPNLQKQMLEIGSKFLWSIRNELKYSKRYPNKIENGIYIQD